MQSLATMIAEETSCLWEALRECRNGGEYNHRQAEGCYYRLRLMISDYIEKRQTGVDEFNLWFSLRVLESFEELTVGSRR